MRRLITKAARLEVQQAAFKRLLDRGYSHEVYKGLNIFTKSEEIGGQVRYYVDIYRDTSSNKINGNYYYTKPERVDQVIRDAKSSYDNAIAWKEERKSKGGYQSGSAQCAAAIRAELKEKFPGFKFSVTSDTFANGNSVRIAWNDGPTTDEVEAITDKYQYGHFDGMQDMYEYSNVNEDIPQAKFVHTDRRMSDATRVVLTPMAESMIEPDAHNRDVLYMIFRKTSLPAGAVVTALERSDVMGGGIEDFYRIAFTAPNTPQKNETPSEEPNFEKVEVPAGEIQIVDYSERAFAVIGETKPIKDHLFNLGGKFNRNLSCGPGWIFSKKRLDSVQKALEEMASVGNVNNQKEVAHV